MLIFYVTVGISGGKAWAEEDP